MILHTEDKRPERAICRLPPALPASLNSNSSHSMLLVTQRTLFESNAGQDHTT